LYERQRESGIKKNNTQNAKKKFHTKYLLDFFEFIELSPNLRIFYCGCVDAFIFLILFSLIFLNFSSSFFFFFAIHKMIFFFKIFFNKNFKDHKFEIIVA